MSRVLYAHPFQLTPWPANYRNPSGRWRRNCLYRYGLAATPGSSHHSIPYTAKCSFQTMPTSAFLNPAFGTKRTLKVPALAFMATTWRDFLLPPLAIHENMPGD